MPYSRCLPPPWTVVERATVLASVGTVRGASEGSRAQRSGRRASTMRLMRKKKSIAERARARGLSPRTVQERMKRGWSLGRALTAQGQKTLSFSTEQRQRIKESGLKYNTVYIRMKRGQTFEGAIMTPTTRGYGGRLVGMPARVKHGYLARGWRPIRHHRERQGAVAVTIATAPEKFRRFLIVGRARSSNPGPVVPIPVPV
jgi:hypothetical protein